MNAQGPQIPLPLPHRAARGRNEFLVSNSNEVAVAWVDRWPDWPAPLLVLAGPPGSGKTHLAHVWCERADAQLVDAADLTVKAVPDLLATGALVVENVEAVADEAALFHLLNYARENSAYLLLTSGTASMRFGLADLASRIKAAPHAELGEPDEVLLTQLIAKHFDDRGIHVTPEILDYVLNRIERSAAAAQAAVARIDDYALGHNRRLNLALVREVLARQGG